MQRNIRSKNQKVTQKNILICRRKFTVNIRKTPGFLLALLIFSSPPVKSVEMCEIVSGCIIGGVFVGSMALYYYYPIVSCGGCGRLISAKDQELIRIDFIRPKCGHLFHPRCLDTWGTPWNPRYTIPYSSVCFYCEKEKKEINKE
jgi:hypothetical protein